MNLHKCFNLHVCPSLRRRCWLASPFQSFMLHGNCTGVHYKVTFDLKIHTSLDEILWSISAKLGYDSKRAKFLVTRLKNFQPSSVSQVLWYLNSMQCYSILCNAMQCYAMLCNAMQFYAMLCYAMQYNAIQCYQMQCKCHWGNKTLLKDVAQLMAEKTQP